MNIKDFEKEIDSKILARGKDYFAKGLMDNLEEEDGRYMATVSGTDDYTVNVLLSESGEIQELSCDCPYEFGDVCKHEVATLLAIRKKRNAPAEIKPPKAKKAKVNLRELLYKQTKESLVELLCSMAEEDRALQQTLLLRFSRQDDELELSRKLIREHIRRCKKRGFIEWNQVDAALRGAWAVLERAEACVESDCSRTVRLCLVVLPEAMSMLDFCDDSDGGVGDIISSCIEIIRKAVLVGQNTLPKYGRDELFQLVLEESRQDTYGGWYDLRLGLLDSLVPLCGDPALYQKLWEQLELERRGFGNRGEYYGQIIAERQLRLLLAWDEKEKARQFVMEHLQYPTFRRHAIDSAMKQSDYAAALRYAEEGLRQNTQHAGLAHEWRTAAFEAYKAMGNTEKMRELADYFVRNHQEGIHYYSVLKDLTSSEKWPEVLRDLLIFFETQRYYSRTYTEILITEKDFDRLLGFCRKNLSGIAEFGARFPSEYNKKVEDIYRELILHEVKDADGRSKYKAVCRLLKGFGGVCGKDKMYALAQMLKETYPRRPALLDELSKLR